MKDPIIEDIHKARAKLSARFGHDVSALGAFLRKEQKKHKGKLVSFAEKRTIIKPA